jgi:hypothetical protein
MLEALDFVADALVELLVVLSFVRNEIPKSGVMGN